MIDLSITKDPDWIKHREKLWETVAKDLKEGLRKDNLEKVHRYFLTGDHSQLASFGIDAEAGNFTWFPIQTPAAWDYLFQYVIQDKKYYEHFFYLSFENLSVRALSTEEELAMWDYFAGEKFNPVVTSRVPVGEKKEFVSLTIDKRNINSKFGLFFKNWASGYNLTNEPKHIRRINYWLDMLGTIGDDVFLEKNSDGEPTSKLGFSVSLAFERVCRPEYATHVSLSPESIDVRRRFFAELRGKLDDLDMPPEMKAIWESTKLKGIIE